MLGAVPQVARRMGIGRGVRTSCADNRPPTSPLVGLQRQSSFNGGNEDHGAFQDSEIDSGRVVLQERFGTLAPPDHAAQNPSSAQTNGSPGELMYSISACRPETGTKLIGLLVDRTQDPSPPVMTNPVFGETAEKTAQNYLVNGCVTQIQNSPRREDAAVNVAVIEAEQLQRRKIERMFVEQPASFDMSQDARDRRKAAFARFLRPALLQAQVDKKKRVEVVAPNVSATERVDRDGPPSLQIPDSATKIEDESLMRTTASSELSNGHGPGAGLSVDVSAQSTMEQRVLRAFEAVNGNAGEKVVSIPAPSVSHVPIRASLSSCSSPPSSHPVTIQPMSDLESLSTKSLADGTTWKYMRASPNSVRAGIRPTHQKKGAHVSSGQECIKKKRRYAVGEWKSFIIKNFCSEDGQAMAVWITETEANHDLEEQLKNIDCNVLNALASHMLGGAAMMKSGEQFLRVTIADLRYDEATVSCVDSGETFEVPVNDLYPLPQKLKSIPPLALRVIVESDRITDAKRLGAALQLAKDHQTVTEGCALTWDFTPKFVFRLPGCRALAVSKDQMSVRWHQNSLHKDSALQRLYLDLPGVLLPASGSTMKHCLVTHIEGSTIYITWEDLHNFMLEPAIEELPLTYEVGQMCAVPTNTESGIQLRCCIEGLQDETAWVRWIDCGALFEVAKEYLLPLPAELVYPPGTVKATLANFTSEDLESAGEDLSHVLLSLKDLNVFFLDLKPVPGVIIFTENFTEVKLENLETLKTLCHDVPANGTCDESEVQEPADTVPEEAGIQTEVEETQPEPEQPQSAFVVGIAAFSQVWVVPKESMGELEEMENRLTRSKPPDLQDCEPETLCAAMHENKLHRALVRLRIGRRFLVRLVDRALDISATRIFELPEEFRDFPSPCYCIGLCPQQIKDVHFGRFISVLKRHPEVTLTPPSASAETNTDTASISGSEHSSHESSHRSTAPKFFLTTTDGEDIMTAYGIREQPQ